METVGTIALRHATHADVDELSVLIEQSVRVLQRETYTQRQIDLAVSHVYGVDSFLIDDQTYFVLEGAADIVSCGGWSKRAKLCGGDASAARAYDLLDPKRDAAKIRAFFVRPGHERRGLATRLLERCEREASAAGFHRVELGSTLAGVPFYAARGYAAIGSADVLLSNGEPLPVVHMERLLV